MPKLFLQTVIALAFAALLQGCGAGGVASVVPSDPDSGIGGTGVTSSGTIDGFGSIFVNGIKFETDDAEIIVDGERAGERDLALGMVVVVTGTINEDGVTGVAERVEYDEEVQGPINSITEGDDGDTLLLDVLGKEVIVERTGTVLDEVTYESIDVGDVVEISGFANEDAQVRATRVEKKSESFVGANEVELKGEVTEVTETQFRLGGIFINYNAADLSDIPGGVIEEGAEVEVQGEFVGTAILASRVEEEEELTEEISEDSALDVQGAVTGFVSLAEFEVNGIRVDASAAALYPADFQINEGMEIQVDGVWDGQTLVANELRARRGRIEIEARVALVDPNLASITLGLYGGDVTVELEADTRLNDDTEVVEVLTIHDITAGDFLGVEAVRAADRLVATRIDRVEPGDEVLQAPVDDFAQGIGVTLLGVGYSTLGTVFENGEDTTISPIDFYGQLQVGDLVKVRDRELADGRADSIEFEAADALDSDSEFDGDCPASESDDTDETDGTCSSEFEDAGGADTQSSEGELDIETGGAKQLPENDELPE